ncbi:peptidase inhibitor family I36 protein [Streptosporangium sp. NPDC049644]|uniref:peptidase inhibitor family I36 protein n=1 Tax=Streptosporangium sp. NPDC049644 TaxID=3155507 RepID=UPI00343DBF77
MRSCKFSIIAATALAVGGTLLPAVPANAAPSDCNAGRICLFTDYNFTGAVYEYMYLTPLPDCFNVPPTHNDRASSVINNTGQPVTLHQDYHQNGKFIFVTRGESIARLDGVPIYNQNATYFGWNTFNDRTSSICVG